MRQGTLIIGGIAIVAIAMGVTFLLYGRNNTPDASSNVVNSQPAAIVVPFTSLARGSRSTVATRVNYFITSADQLDKLWKMVDATSTPPKIDFTTHAVVAVFSGKQSTTGYAISVSKVVDSNARVVSVLLAKPDGNCMLAQATTAPYQIVVVPTTTLPLAHEDLVATTSCSR